MVVPARNNQKYVYTPRLEMEEEVTLTSGQYLASGGGLSRRHILLQTLRARICSCCRHSSTQKFLFSIISLSIILGLMLSSHSHPQKSEKADLSNPKEPSTVIEHDDPREIDILNKLHIISGQSIYQEGSPQFQATNWILKEDDMTTRATDPFLVQRYILAILYFQREEGSTKNWGTWLSIAGSECFWFGVDCDNGSVTGIQLDYHDLVGTIPSEIGRLQQLKKLDLSFNKFTGAIPPELGALDNLESLILNQNALIGVVPLQLCLLREAEKLNILIAHCGIGVEKLSCDCCTDCEKSDNNKDPSAINTKKNDSSLGDNDSNMDLNQASNRKTLIYGVCTKLSGKIVFTQGSPQNLAMNWMIHNDKSMLGVETYYFVQRYVMAVMYYSLCEETWTFDSWLSPSENECLFQGVTCGAKQVIKLTFVKMGMVGTLPKEISNLIEVTSIDFSQNEISGGIPTSWKFLSNLDTLILRDNEISGPMVLCNLYFDHSLERVEVDCNKISSCECCSNCAAIDIRPVKEGVLPSLNTVPSLTIMPIQYTVPSQHPTLSKNTIPNQNTRPSQKHDIIPSLNTRPSQKHDIIPSLKSYHRYTMPSQHPTQSKNTISNQNTISSQNTRPSQKHNIMPSQHFFPPDDARAKEIREELQKVSTIRGYVPNKVRIRAQNWVIHEDSQILSATSQYLKERYILAVIYFVLEGSNWAGTTDSDKWTSTTSNTMWLKADTNCCYWGGIRCNREEYVESIELPLQNLHGTMPYEIAQLFHLRILDLNSNHVTRAIPREFGQMSLLTLLILNNNTMSGDVPHSVCMLREQGNLANLWVDCNPDDEYRVTCPQNVYKCCTCGASNQNKDFLLP